MIDAARPCRNQCQLSVAVESYLAFRECGRRAAHYVIFVARGPVAGPHPGRRVCSASPGAQFDVTDRGDVGMSDAVTAQESLEAVLKDEIIRMYQDVADKPGGEYHFFHGREAAELFGYDPAWLDRAPAGAVASFAGVGNPHLRSEIRPGETVVDLGSGAGLDAIIASWSAGDSHACTPIVTSGSAYVNLG